jgi:hypothetical protein
MSQIIKDSPEYKPIILAKVKGNQAAELKKDDLIWYSVYEPLLKLTVVFIPVEKATSDADKKLFEKSTKIYLQNKKMNVISTQYHDTAEKLKQYLTLK